MRYPFGLAASLALIIGPASAAEPIQQAAAFVQAYCVDCHGVDDPEGGLDLETAAFRDNGASALSDITRWEKAVKRVRARQMPPVDATKPDEEEYAAALRAMEAVLDEIAAEHPMPGRTESIRRLNRTEYANAIRDLLSLEVDVASLLPKDQSGHGFDNVTLGGLTPTLLTRYLAAAESIARQAVGGLQRTPGGATIRIAPDRTQQEHAPGLPLGTRGGVLIDHHFVQSGEYEVQVRLARDRDEHVEGLHEPHEIDLLLDRELVERFEVVPVKREPGQSYEMIDHSLVDKHLVKRFQVPAGPHKLGVTFVRNGETLSNNKRQPFHAAFNRHRHPRPEPAIFEVSIIGPFEPHDPGDTPSRRRVFTSNPSGDSFDEAESCAEQSLRRLLRLAYRRPINDEDLAKPLAFFERGWKTGGLGLSAYEAGMQLALTSVLVNPHFLLRVETDPSGSQPDEVYAVSGVELASRLSFFLWSSLPDDELLALAESGELLDERVLREQVARMLGDPRSDSLVKNFASQWLHLRNLDSVQPNLRQFPNFDDNLRQAFRRETELLFESIVREDRSVLDLITSETTYLNERLAKHYGVPGVVGSHYRPVRVPSELHRGGLLRHGSLLAVTSYTTRTAPTIRGAWVLDNLLGTPPPPPPPNVENLKDKAASASLTMRERLAEHRANPACASCHDLIDPIGFALENYDAVGRWRNFEGETSIDSSGVLPDGRAVASVEDLEAGLLAHPEVFVTAMAEKLLTFGLGRGVAETDASAIRKAVRRAAENDYRFSSLIEGIVLSDPFLMRAVSEAPYPKE